MIPPRSLWFQEQTKRRIEAYLRKRAEQRKYHNPKIDPYVGGEF